VHFFLFSSFILSLFRSIDVEERLGKETLDFNYPNYFMFPTSSYNFWARRVGDVESKEGKEKKNSTGGRKRV